MGFFYRTIRMVENGIKPMYVFDGKPPELKAGVVCGPGQPVLRHYSQGLQLSKRFARREEAKEEGEEAKETGQWSALYIFLLANLDAPVLRHGRGCRSVCAANGQGHARAQRRVQEAVGSNGHSICRCTHLACFSVYITS